MNNVTRLSALFFRTLREDPSAAEVESHKLLLRAGYIRQVAPGVFSWLPLGLRVLRKIETIIREEMEAIGAQELHFPALLPREPYETTNRWTEYGPNIFRLKDRRDTDYLLAPTHEEMFALIVKDLCNSYKDLPKQLYQIQTKYRDEARPRAGLLRGREFIMKDAYSFDMSDAGLAESYQLYRGAYQKIFDRLELPYVVVQATSGAMGGSKSEEFLSPTPIGEDTFVVAPSGYAANVEAAEIKTPADLPAGEIEGLAAAEVFATPGLKTIEDLQGLTGQPPSQFLKAVYLTLEHPAQLNTGKPGADSKSAQGSEPLAQEVVIVCIPGDRELDEKRAEAFFAPAEIRQSTPEDLAKLPHLVPGFVGPFANEAAAQKTRFFFDTSVFKGSSWVAGANERDKHVKNLVAGRDFEIIDERRIGVIEVRDGDEAADGSGKLEIARGVEIGHIFALGRKYTEAFEVKVLDEFGKAASPTMGSYGIGVTRALALLAENFRDDLGLAWPAQVAPAGIHIVVASKDDSAYSLAEKAAAELSEKGLEILLDDRLGVSPGVKFKDAELIGVPKIVVFGRGLQSETPSVEVKNRDGSQKREVLLENLVEELLAC